MGRIRYLLTGFVALAFLGTGFGGTANALTPPAAPSSIAFSFGDRIVRIAADGS